MMNIVMMIMIGIRRVVDIDVVGQDPFLGIEKEGLIVPNQDL